MPWTHVISLLNDSKTNLSNMAELYIGHKKQINKYFFLNIKEDLGGNVFHFMDSYK